MKPRTCPTTGHVCPESDEYEEHIAVCSFGADNTRPVCLVHIEFLLRKVKELEKHIKAHTDECPERAHGKRWRKK